MGNIRDLSFDDLPRANSSGNSAPIGAREISFDDLPRAKKEDAIDWQDIIRKIGLAGRGAAEGVMAGPMMIGDLADLPLRKLQELVTGKSRPSPSEGLKADLNRFTDQPKTPADRLVMDAAGGAAGALAGPGKALANAAFGMAGGAAAGLTREQGGGLPAQILAGLAPAAGAGAVSAVNRFSNGGASRMLQNAGGDTMTPENIEAARKALALAKSQGIDLAGPEVLPASGMQQLMSDVASSRVGGAVINKFMANRPGQVRQAVDKNLLSKVSRETSADTNMALAKKTATDAIGDAETKRTNLARPYYAQAETESVPPEAMQGIINSIDDALAKTSDPRVIKELTGYRQALETKLGPETRLSSLMKTEQLNRYENMIPEIGATGEQRVKANILNPFNSQLSKTLKDNNENFKTGAQVYSEFSENVLNPLTSGPVGRVAGRQGFDPSMPQTLNPVSAISNEKIADPAAIRELYTTLNAKDAKAFPGLARTWLDNAFDAASTDVQGAANRMSGSNFAKNVFNTPKQRENFGEIMRGVALANGKDGKQADAFAKGANNLMETLRLTARIPGVGSPTGGRLNTDKMASSSLLASSVEAVSTNPFAGAGGKLREWANAGAYKKLAEAMTAPDTIDQIIKLGKYDPKGATAQWFVASLLGINASRQSDQGRDSQQFQQLQE